MGIFNKIKRLIKRVSLVLLTLPIALKIVALLTLIITVTTVLSNLYETITAKNTPIKIYEDLEVEDVSELIEIKGNALTGYYLDFVDDIDVKLINLIETLNTSGSYHYIPNDTEFLKKLIQAEVVTKFPDLGGEIPDGESGFQGAIDIKRVTPNKEVGEMKNTGKGDTTLIETETSYDDLDITPKEEEIKSWEEGKKLVLYSDAYVYDEEANLWTKREENNQYVIIYATDDVEYTGKYEKVEDKLNDTTVFYIEVRSGSVTGHIRSSTIDINTTNNGKLETNANENNNQDSESSGEEEITGTTSRATTDTRTKETIGEASREYRVAIAAGHNNTDNIGARSQSGDLVEEELNIEVAELVEEIINEKYENVTVIQTGSTSSNPGGVKKSERTQLARDANPDLCIQIHFNAAESADVNGVEVIYKEGDGYSQQLSEILTKAISSAMGLTDKGAGPDTERAAVGSLGIIENYATSGFPSVVTEGGYLTGNIDADVIRNGGVEKYAQGIVDGIKEYLETDHSGLTATSNGDTQITTSIESRIVNMKYISPEEFEIIKSTGSLPGIFDPNFANITDQAIKYFTLNDENQLVTLTWVMDENGHIELKENAAMDFRTSLQQYHMPYEYLLYYYIDTDYRDFSERLADIVLDSEIVVTLQDNVTTTQTMEDIESKVETSLTNSVFDGGAHDWEVKSHTETITEVCTTKIDLTYVETWCVKTYKDNSFSEKVLQMGEQDEIIANIPGQVTYAKGKNQIGEEKIIEESEKNSLLEGTYTYIEKERTITTTNTLMSAYNTGGDAKVEGITNKYVDLYIDEQMNKRMQEEWFFDIVENNERTANLLDLTKYLIFIATNTNLGVTEYDFSIFDLDAFQSISGSGSQMDLLVEYIHYFEHSSPPPTNADGTKYIIESDPVGNAVVGYGVDIFNGGFAEEFRQAGYPTSIGGEVDKDFVDNLEKRETEEKMESVKSLTSGLNLTGYQINALVSRAYNCGVARSNFNFKRKSGNEFCKFI